MTEVVDLLQRLIRVDTTNPPGNETAAAELLRDYLEAAASSASLREGARAGEPRRADPGPRRRAVARAALAHRRRARRCARVAASTRSARELRRRRGLGPRRARHEGRGRGERRRARNARARRLARRGDLIFVAAADEEVGDGFGLQWLVDAHPDAVRADFSVNEGAGDRVELGGKVLYLCSTAEKMSSPFMLRVHGRSGHASMPGIADNALVKAAPLVERLGAFTVEPR